MDLTLSTREADGTTVVAVGGEIDVYTAPRLRYKFTELVASGSYDFQGRLRRRLQHPRVLQPSVTSQSGQSHSGLSG